MVEHSAVLPTLINYQEIETFLHETRVREIDEQNIPDLSTMFGMLAVTCQTFRNLKPARLIKPSTWALKIRLKIWEQFSKAVNVCCIFLCSVRVYCLKPFIIYTTFHLLDALNGWTYHLDRSSTSPSVVRDSRTQFGLIDRAANRFPGGFTSLSCTAPTR